MTKDFNELELQELRWVKEPGFWSRNFNLENAQGAMVGKLIRPKWWDHSYTEIDAPGNRWVFQRVGFLQNQIVVKSLGTMQEVARYHYGMLKGKLVFMDGRTFYWKAINIWGSKYAWLTKDSKPIVGFQANGILASEGELNIDPAVIDMKSLGLLVYMGWYLLLLGLEDSASVATIGAMS